MFGKYRDSTSIITPLVVQSIPPKHLNIRSILFQQLIHNELPHIISYTLIYVIDTIEILNL